MKMPAEEAMDVYVADTLFRKRDYRFADRDKYKKRLRKERARKEFRSNLFTAKDFTFAEDRSH